MNENNIPRWNLDSLYPSLNSTEYKNDLLELEETFSKLQVQLDAPKSDFPAWLNSYLALLNKEAFLLKTLGAYAYIIYSTDTTNPAYMNNLNLMDKYDTQAQQIFIKFSTILADNEKFLENFYKQYPEKEEYRYLLKEIIEEKSHQMAPELEELASKMSHTGASAWSLLQEQIISNLHDDEGKTFNELRNDANDADPALRKSSWEKEVALLAQNRIAFGAALNNLKGEKITLNEKRDWKEGLDNALFNSRLSRKTLDALIGAIEDSLPVWRKYFQAKAAMLRASNSTVSKTAGTKEHPGIAFYDLFAPIEKPKALGKSDKDDDGSTSLISKKWNFKEACDYVIKKYYSFSKNMGDFAQNAVDQQWIDALVRPGKVGGAYDEDFPKGHQSRVLSNFTGAFSDIITLAHELGHAFHFSCMKNKDPLFYDYPMTLAETASTFAETIVKQDMISNSQGFDRMKILDLDLTDTSQVLVDILCRFYFEESVFQARKNSELTADDFCKLMMQAQEKSYGQGLNDEKIPDGSNYTERHDYMWAVKSHYYITSLDFYNFPYAFGQLFAAGLYQRAKQEGSDFAKTYEELLSQTGSMSCEELCKKAGFDITTKDFWKSGIEMYAQEVQKYCNYVLKL